MAESTRCCGMSLGRAAYTLAVLSAVFYGVGIITMITVVSHEGSINKALDDVTAKFHIPQAVTDVLPQLSVAIALREDAENGLRDIAPIMTDSNMVNRMKMINDVYNQSSLTEFAVKLQAMIKNADVNETIEIISAIENRVFFSMKRDDIVKGLFQSWKLTVDSEKAWLKAKEDARMTEGEWIVAQIVFHYRPWLTVRCVSLLVENLLMFAMSLLLIYGLRQRLHAYMLPYLVTYFIGFWVIWTLLMTLMVAVFVAHIGYGFLSLFLFLVIHFVKAIWWFAIRCEFENIKKSTKVTLSNH